MILENVVAEILQLIAQAPPLYYRLILVVGPANTGKTACLYRLKEITGAPVLNINLGLSRRMLDLTERQRQLKASSLVGDIVRTNASELVLLDNIELLFDPSFKLEPLRLLQGLSRNTTIVSSWNGVIDNGYLVYAVPDHPEYKRYPVRDFLYVNLEVKNK